jgi:hypothetical protein
MTVPAGPLSSFFSPSSILLGGLEADPHAPPATAGITRDHPLYFGFDPIVTMRAGMGHGVATGGEVRAHLVVGFPQATLAPGYSADMLTIASGEMGIGFSVDCTPAATEDGDLGLITAVLEVLTVGSAVRPIPSTVYWMDRASLIVTIFLGAPDAHPVYGYDYRFTLLLTTVDGSVLASTLPRIRCRA